jgi:hypothetical protein
LAEITDKRSEIDAGINNKQNNIEESMDKYDKQLVVVERTPVYDFTPWLAQGFIPSAAQWREIFSEPADPAVLSSYLERGDQVEYKDIDSWVVDSTGNVFLRHGDMRWSPLLKQITGARRQGDDPRRPDFKGDPCFNFIGLKPEQVKPGQVKMEPINTNKDMGLEEFAKLNTDVLWGERTQKDIDETKKKLVEMGDEDLLQYIEGINLHCDEMALTTSWELDELSAEDLRTEAKSKSAADAAAPETSLVVQEILFEDDDELEVQIGDDVYVVDKESGSVFKDVWTLARALSDGSQPVGTWDEERRSIDFAAVPRSTPTATADKYEPEPWSNADTDTDAATGVEEQRIEECRYRLEEIKRLKTVTTSLTSKNRILKEIQAAK